MWCQTLVLDKTRLTRTWSTDGASSLTGVHSLLVSDTGIVGNTAADANAFAVSEGGRSGKAIFIFATLDGTIRGWNPQVGGADAGAHATIAADRSGAWRHLHSCGL
jgi:hypothetical protein